MLHKTDILLMFGTHTQTRPTGWEDTRVDFFAFARLLVFAPSSGIRNHPAGTSDGPGWHKWRAVAVVRIAFAMAFFLRPRRDHMLAERYGCSSIYAFGCHSGSIESECVFVFASTESGIVVRLHFTLHSAHNYADCVCVCMF